MTNRILFHLSPPFYSKTLFSPLNTLKRIKEKMRHHGIYGNTTSNLHHWEAVPPHSPELCFHSTYQPIMTVEQHQATVL